MNGAQEITTADLLMKLSLLDSAPWANLRGRWLTSGMLGLGWRS
jgi:hypothetical protein